MDELCSQLSSSPRRRDKCLAVIQPIFKEAKAFGPLPAVPGVVAGAVPVVVVVESLVSIVGPNASYCRGNVAISVAGSGVPLDGNGTARAEMTRRSILVMRENGCIFLPLLISKQAKSFRQCDFEDVRIGSYTEQGVPSLFSGQWKATQKRKDISQLHKENIPRLGRSFGREWADKRRLGAQRD